MAGADLHLHSTASDGRFPPREVIRRAFGAELAAVSLTDHDTIAGLAEASREASRLRMTFIPGCEFSVAEEEREIHILAYFINPLDANLHKLLARMRRNREDRIVQMVEKLRQGGLKIRLDDVNREAAQSSAIGRPHIARALVRMDQVKNQGDCFKHWLGLGGRAYVPKQTPPGREVVTSIWNAGGVPVLAHPGFYGILAIEAIFSRLDLGGIEVEHPSHSPGQRRKLAHWAQANDVTATGGSDWHGNETAEAYAGCRRVSTAVVDQLRRQIKSAPDFNGGGYGR